MDLLKAYAFSLIGIPYRWGGENPISGFDCSGLVQELLKSVGLDPPGDQTAQALYDYFEKNGSVNAWGLGALAFYGEDVTKIIHVAFCLDQYLMIEAGGGGSDTVSRDIADKRNAFVRMRPIKYRKDFLYVIKPYYRTIGML
jgi:cell wall-associated NlpC family hydrolase